MIIWRNIVQISTTQTYYLTKVTKLTTSQKMMRSTRIHCLQGKMMNTTVLMRSTVGKISTQNQNLVMVMSSLRLSTMFLTQEVMVYTSWIYGFIAILTSLMTQTSLHTVYYPWSLCMNMQAEMCNTHTLWHVNTRSSRFFGKVNIRMKITIFCTPSTQRSGCSEKIRVSMYVVTSGKAIYLMTNWFISGINSTPLVLPRFWGRMHTSLPTR